MKQSGFSNNIIIVIIGVITGIGLFLASFSLQLASTVLNEEFHMEAAENLGFFDNISSMLQSISGSVNNGNEQAESALKSGITPSFIKSNVKSLISGLAGYIDMNKFLEVLDLIRFILFKSIIYSSLIFALVLAVMLFKSPAEIRAWVRSAAVSYALVYPAAVRLLGLALHRIASGYGAEKIQGVLAVSRFALEEPVTGYISYLTGFLTTRAVISGTILFFGVEAAIFIICPRKPRNLAHFGSSSRQPLVNKTYVLFPALLLPAAAASMQIMFAKQYLAGMDFPDTIAFAVKNTVSVSVTDARDQEVCFLNVAISDENGDVPADSLDLALYPAGSSMPVENTSTGAEGSSFFLLEKGRYRIVLNPVSSDPAVFDFELDNAGRTDLFITIGKTKSGTAYIKDTSMLYMP
ncbi:MAG: hypothetical protein ACM3XR_02250 [Bacillota bacterium]